MKLALISDVHANFPALQAVVADIQQRGCHRIIHLGDAIAIGSQPAETLELLLSLPNAQFVMGNHDAYFAYGIPDPQPPYMNDGEVSHHQWTHQQIEASFGGFAKAAMDEWPFLIQEEVEGVKIAFLHYALDETGRDFMTIERNPTVTVLAVIFAQVTANLICYGHTHWLGDLQGRKRYLNVPSLGCQPTAVAPYTILRVENGAVQVEQVQVKYDDSEFLAAYEARQVPERQFLRTRFLGGR